VRRGEEALQRGFDVATAVAAVATAPILIALTLDLPQGLYDVLLAANWAAWGVFALELVVMLAVTRDRSAWLRTHSLTPVLVLLTPPPFRALALLRVARLLRGPLGRRAAAAATSRDGLRNLALMTLLTVGLGGVLFSLVEPHVDTADGIYWAVVTVTTVGYGDIVPTTTPGKVLAVYVMLTGVGFLAILTGAIAERFVARMRERGEAGAAGPERDAVLAKLDELGQRMAALERAVAGRRD
jgi:voltage-gated potassium channel